eukprot:jgi/Orpsp1_1/1175259/evm.model.c7180000053183.1
MKSFLFTSLTIFLCVLGMSKGEDVQISHQETNYNLSSFKEPTEINSVKCESDSDCFSNSCVEGLCKFYFLCPENEEENCVSVTTEAWKTYDSREENDVHPENYKPILRSCYKEELHTNILAKILAPNCDTVMCEKDNDCLFGTCYNSTCITETPIYKCNSEDLVCKKANFIKCTYDDECYSEHCISGFCIENPYPSIKSGVIRSFIIAILIRLGKSLIKFSYGGAKKHRANKDDKKSKKSEKAKKEE